MTKGGDWYEINLMKEESYPFEMIVREIGISPDDAESAICRFLKWLSSRIRNYEGNRDFIGEELHWIVSRATFYHLLGLFDDFSERYSWEKGSAKEYLLRIAPRDEWPNYIDESTEIPKPEAAMVAASMIYVCNLAKDQRSDIDLVVCAFNSRLYARINVNENLVVDCAESPKIDYVPLTPADLTGLMGLEAQAMLLRIQNLSKEQDCIVTSQGKARWVDHVFYPYT
jgi:hypothetical protein